MSKDKKIRIVMSGSNMVPSTAGGVSGRVFSTLPEDNLGFRIGIAATVSIGINFLVLYGASVMANSMTITMPEKDPNVSGETQLIIQNASPRPQATPTPEATPSPEPTPRPRNSVVPTPVPTPEPKRITEEKPATPPPTPESKQNFTEATPVPATPIPTTPPPIKQHEMASQVADNTTPRSTTEERPVSPRTQTSRPTNISSDPSLTTQPTDTSANPTNVIRETAVHAATNVPATRTSRSHNAVKTSSSFATVDTPSSNRESAVNSVNNIATSSKATNISELSAPSMASANSVEAANSITREAKEPGRMMSISASVGKTSEAGKLRSTNVPTEMEGASGQRSAATTASPITISRNSTNRGPAEAINPATSSVSATTEMPGLQRQHETVANARIRTTGRPRILTMNSEAARVTHTENVAPEGGALRPGEATVRAFSGTNSTSRAVSKVASGNASLGTYDVRVEAVGVIRNGAPSVAGTTTAPKGKNVGHSIAAVGKATGDGMPTSVESGQRNGSVAAPNGLVTNSRTNGTPGGSGNVNAASGVGNLPNGDGTGINGNRNIGTSADGKGQGKSKTGLGSGNASLNSKSGAGAGEIDIPGGDSRTGGGKIQGNSGTRGQGGVASGSGITSGTPGDIGNGANSGLTREGSTGVATKSIETEPATTRESDRPARKKSGSAPTIPDDLRSEQFSANITAKFEISASGRSTVRLTKGSGNSTIDAVVLRTLGRWSWEPAKKNGKAVDADETVEIRLNVN